MSSTDRIEKKVQLRAPRSRVWKALTDSREFGAWFGVRFDRAFEPGQPIRGTMTPTQVDAAVAASQKAFEGRPFDINVDRIEPERLFSFRWHPFAVDPNHDYSGEPMTLVEFHLTEQAGGTLLTVVETGFDKLPPERRAKAFGMNEQGWAFQMNLVAKYVDGGA